MLTLGRCAVGVGLMTVAALAWVSDGSAQPPIGGTKCSINGVPVPCGDAPSRGGTGSRPPQPSGPTREELGINTYNEGVAYFRQGRWTDAEQAFRRAIDLRPNDRDAHAALGAALSRQVTPERWKRALDLVRKNPHFSTMEDDLIRAAIEAYGKAAQLGKHDANAQIERLRAMAAEYEQALAAGRRAQEQRDRGWEEHAAGRRLGDGGRWSEAEQHFRRATRILQYDFQPNAQNPYYMLAVSLHNQGKLVEAIAAYEDLLRREPGHVRAREWVAMAKASLAERNNDYRSAAVHAREAIVVNPQNATAHAKLGWALYKEQRIDEAEKALRESLRLAPNVVSRRQDLAVVLASRAANEEAERELRQALRLEPGNARTVRLLETVTLNRVGLLRFEQKDGEAAQVLRRALADLPEAMPLRAALVNVLLARADAMGSRQAANAEALYRETIALAPDNARAHNNLGVLLQGQGKTREAEAAYREVIRLEPGNAHGYRNLAALLQQQGRVQEAVTIYRERLRAQPDDQVASQGLQTVVAADAQGRVNRLLDGLTPFPNKPIVGGPTPGAKPSALDEIENRTTADQLASAKKHADIYKDGGADEATIMEARRAFDIPPTLQGTLEIPKLQGGPRFRDPVIPEALRNDRVTMELVTKREAAKKDVAELEQKLQALEQQPRRPERDVQVAQAKQAVATAEQRVHLVNAVIREHVDLSFTPPSDAGATEAAPEKGPTTPGQNAVPENEPSRR